MGRSQDCPCDNCVKYAECRAGIGGQGWITCDDKRAASNSDTAHAGCIIFRTGDPQYCHAMYCTGVSLDESGAKQPLLRGPNNSSSNLGSSTYNFDEANWTPGQCDSGSISSDDSAIIGIWCP